MDVLALLHLLSCSQSLSFLDIIKTNLTFTKRFQLKYGFPFIGAKTEHLQVDSKGSNFLLGESSATCKRNIGVAHTMLQCFEALKFQKDETFEVFGAMNLGNKTLATSKNTDTMLLLSAAQYFLTNPDG